MEALALAAAAGVATYLIGFARSRLAPATITAIGTALASTAAVAAPEVAEVGSIESFFAVFAGAVLIRLKDDFSPRHDRADDSLSHAVAARREHVRFR